MHDADRIIEVDHAQHRKTRALIREIGAEILAAIQQLADQRPKLQLGEPKIMFIVKDDNPDVNFSITAPTVNDSEGHPVDPQPALTFDVVSDNPDAVAVTFDPATKTGSVHFGAPGLANVNVSVTDPADNLVGSFGAQFTVTTGNPAAITGGGISFDGLTES